MSRIDEMIYHLEMMEKNFNHNIATNQQVVEGEERFVCMVCGHCPAAEAEWLRAIKVELQANSEPKSKLAKEGKQ